jgi:outer membrane protein
MQSIIKSTVISLIILGIGLTTYHFLFVKKIAYVESSKVIDSFSEAIKARKKLEADIEQWDKELKKIEDSLNASSTAFKEGFEKAAHAKKKELAANLEKWNGDYARYGRSIEQKKLTREQELMQPVIEKINKFMEVWGNEHGYQFIFGTMAGGNIVMADRKFDVTNKVIQDLNKHYKN